MAPVLHSAFYRGGIASLRDGESVRRLCGHAIRDREADGLGDAQRHSLVGAAV